MQRHLFTAALGLMIGGLVVAGYNLTASGAMGTASWVSGLLVALGLAVLVAGLLSRRPVPTTGK